MKLFNSHMFVHRIQSEVVGFRLPSHVTSYTSCEFPNSFLVCIKCYQDLCNIILHVKVKDELGKHECCS